MSLERVMTILRSRKLEGIAEPCLQFRTVPALELEHGLGSSKLGGSPELPIELPWPTWYGKPLDFLLQLDCSEIPLHLKDGLLPKTGWIYFFYDTESNMWGHDQKHRGSWRVLFFDGDRKSLVRRRCLGSTNVPFRPCSLVFYQGIHLNWRSIMEYPELIADLDHLYRQEDLLGAMAEISGHQILGNTEGAQRSCEEMQEQCQFVSNRIDMGGGDDPLFDEVEATQLEPGIKDWRLLLALHSDDNAALVWRDFGTLYFWIREEDLRNSDFHNVWVIFQCL